MNIDELFHDGIRAHERLVNAYGTDQRPIAEKAYEVARGAFRVAILDLMREEIDASMEVYAEAAMVIKECWEELHHLDMFFRKQGVPSGLPSGFLASVKVPAPNPKFPSLVDGRAAPRFQCDVSDILTKEGQQLFDDDWVEECEAPQPVQSYTRKLKQNEPLGYG
jgi:hypothetical protein